MAKSVVELRDDGLDSLAQLEQIIQKQSDSRQELLEKIKVIETKMDHLSKVMEYAHTIRQYQAIYKYHKENPKDREFEDEYFREIALYKATASEVLKHYKKLPKTKEILEMLNDLDKQKLRLMSEYKDSKTELEKLFAIRKNIKTFNENTLER